MLKLRVLSTDVCVAREGDDVESICRAANVSPVAFCRLNGLTSFSDLRAGMLLALPPAGNLYTVRPGDSAVSLCGSRERFEALNGTSVFYPGMKVRI